MSKKKKSKIPVIVDSVVVSQAAPFQVAGLANNCEFVFFTNKKADHWWFEMSLQPFRSVDTLKGSGDPDQYNLEADFDPNKAHGELDIPFIRGIIGRICKELAVPTLLARQKQRNMV